MRIGIVVAMGKELELLLPIIKDKKEDEKNGFKFFSGSAGGHEVTAMQCGIGKVNAAIGVLTLIDVFCPDLVINTGVAGGADASMHVLDLLVADAVAYHDVWCGPGTEYGRASGYPLFFIPDDRIINISSSIVDKLKIKRGLICSGDKFICTENEVAEIKSNFPSALAVDMESASIAQVCMLRHVPFNILRVISDTPGQEENISQYESFWDDAPKETFGALVGILEAI